MLKEIKPYLQLLKDWTKQEENTVDNIVIKFQKNNYTIVFEEELREHIINFTILHPLKRIIRVYFRECIFADKSLQINNLLSDLKQLGDLTDEKAELKAYFDFLQINNFIKSTL